MLGNPCQPVGQSVTLPPYMAEGNNTLQLTPQLLDAPQTPIQVGFPWGSTSGTKIDGKLRVSQHQYLANRSMLRQQL